jgi:uncharacterized protein
MVERTAHGDRLPDRMSALTITHRATAQSRSRRPAEFHNQGDPLMENHQEELKAHLMATSEEFRALAAQHSELHQQLEQLESKSHLNEQEQMEEVRLKKQKLRLKDQMNALIARSRTQQVA